MKGSLMNFIAFFFICYNHEVKSAHYQPLLNETKVDRLKRDKTDGAPHEFTITLRHDETTTAIKFFRIQRFLANEHLPVLGARHGFDHELRYTLEQNVMKEVGPFVFYQSELGNTAVYFLKHGLLNGYIGAKYAIKNLPWDQYDLIHEVGGPYVSTRNFYDGREEEIVQIRNEITRQKLRPPRNSEFMRKHNFFPELLLVVDYGLYIEYSQNPHSQLSCLASIVCDMLTKFHAADILFHDVSDPGIYLNIAAIVIELEPGFSTSTQIETRQTSYENYPSHRMIQSYQKTFYIHSEIFPSDSFDIVVLMTKYKMYSKGKAATGLAFSTPSSVPVFRNHPCLSVPFFTMIRSSNDNSDTMAISHQIANILIYGYHSKSSIHSGSSVCDLRIVHDVDKIMCEECLQWNENFLRNLRYFAGSMDACIFLNTPRSLGPIVPRVKLSKEEQCRCYGYSNVIDDYIHCQNNINCSDNDCSQLPLPFDGTPCGANKVCWNTQCVHVSY